MAKKRKRTDAKIIEDIWRTDDALNSENLPRDRQELNRHREALVNELGREPGKDEIWDSICDDELKRGLA